MKHHPVLIPFFLVVMALVHPVPPLHAEEISYRLKWLYNVSVIGDVYAEAKGFFDREGLNVSVKEGGPERDPIKELEMGYAQFGVASADQIIRALSKGSPIVVIAQLFQKNPLQWMYRPENIRIDRASDLRGKRIGITYGGNDETIMRTILAQTGIQENEVRLYSVRYDYTPFYQAKVDLWPVYVNAQAVIIRQKLDQAGEKTALFNPEELGIRFVANSVITSAKLLADHPEWVQRFKTGLLEGWKEAMNPAHTKDALQTLARFDRDTPSPIMAEQLEETRKLVHPDGVAVGTIDEAAWKQTEQILLGRKIITKPVHVERFLIR